MKVLKTKFVATKMSTPTKKILIITYYWPPAGGPGVQRWLKFAKYLPNFGYSPIIYTPENPSYPLLDESLIDDVPKGIKVVKRKIWEPYHIAEKLSKKNKKYKGGQFDIGKNQSWKSRLSIWIRGNFFIPDARVFWVKPSVKYLKKYIREEGIDTVITTGPPHSMHLIGLRLKENQPHLKWIADFRDPWTEISYYKHLKLSRYADKKHKRLELAVFRKADLTLATSYTDAQHFSEKGARAICITNGFDEEQTTDLQKGEKFCLSYVGVLEQLRNPEVLWEALAELAASNEDFKRDFLMKFVGRVDEKISAQIENTILKDNVLYLGYQSHSIAVGEMMGSDVLLLTNFPEEASRGIIPGKIFEYIATGNKVISFGVKDADVSTILKETSAGEHFLYDEKDRVKDYILSLYRLWKDGNLLRNTNTISQFSRERLTQKLVETIESL